MASEPSGIQIAATNMPLVTATCPALQPYGKTSIDVNLPESFESGQSYDLRITAGTHLQQPTVYTAEKVNVP